MYAVAGAERGVPFRSRDRAHDSRLDHEVLHGSRGRRWLGVVPLSKVRRVVPSQIPGNRLTIWEFSNEVQNFLYLSRSSTPPTSEKVWMSPSCKSTSDPSLMLSVDFRAMVDPSMPMEYAKKHFAPALQTAVKWV